uniref:Putative secreted protein n=1 Tax=Hyalomma excavatum TaxID=257692 RepID=A0A131XQ09_9ACAR
MSKLLAVILLAAIVVDLLEAKPSVQSRTEDDDENVEYDSYPDDVDDNNDSDEGSTARAIPRLPVANSGGDSEAFPEPVD